MTDVKLPYLLLFLLSPLVSSISQVLLKKAAMKSHKSWIQEYTDPLVVIGYILFVGCTFITMFAYRGVPLNYGPILETTAYIYVLISGAIFFNEKITLQKVIALGLILTGIVIYAI